MPSTLVVVPTYMEAGNIERLLRSVRAVAPDAHILVVDDNSPDGTAKVAETLNDELGQIHVLNREADMTQIVGLVDYRDHAKLRETLQ